MRRRRLLALLGSGLTAGCAGLGGDSQDGTTPTPLPVPTDGATRGTPAAPPRNPVENTVQPCRRYCDTGGIVWWDFAAERDAPTFVRPSAVTGSLPDFDVRFDLLNESARPLQFAPGSWRFSKFADGDWYDVVTGPGGAATETLDLGSRYTWPLRLRSSLPTSPPQSIAGVGTRIPGLGGGSYVFGIDGTFEGEAGVSVTCAAQVTVSGEPVELEPTDAVRSTRVEGDRLVATVDREGPASEGSRAFSYRVAPVESVPPGESAPELIPEQLVRRFQLRDGIALLDAFDVEAVEIREQSAIIPSFVDGDAQYYRYSGQTYAVTVVGGG